VNSESIVIVEQILINSESYPKLDSLDYTLSMELDWFDLDNTQNYPRYAEKAFSTGSGLASTPQTTPTPIQVYALGNPHFWGLKNGVLRRRDLASCVAGCARYCYCYVFVCLSPDIKAIYARSSTRSYRRICNMRTCRHSYNKYNNRVNF
jgi:hypothetical protein